LSGEITTTTEADKRNSLGYDSQNPTEHRRLSEPDESEESPYRMKDEPEHVPPPVPPRSWEKKKQKPRGDETPEEANRNRDILEKEELPPLYPWWMEAAITGAVAGSLLIVGIILAMLKVKAGGVGVGAMLVVVILICTVVQTIIMAAFLMVLGGLINIDYGPVHMAMVKLVAIVFLVNALSLVITAGCAPIGMMVAVIVGAMVFQRLFQLTIQETMLSTAAIVLTGWVLNALIIAFLLRKFVLPPGS
jgi:hypothetical protein